MKRFPVIAVLLLPLLLLAAAGRGPLEFTALDGGVSDFSGTDADSPLILHFWATWCPSCAEEMQVLELEAAACAPGRVAVVAVNVDEDVETVRRYWKKHDLKLTVVRDAGGDEWRRLGGRGLPFNWIKHPKGSRTLTGPRDASAWRAVLAELGCERTG
jgi:thiol-disulfide isomerase/thioredoxin